jgi:hypothetical protein
MSLIDAKDNLEDIKDVLVNALNRAGNDKRSAFRFIILNTISEEFPNSRYVVLRKFKTETASLFMYTDYRSNKIREIQTNPLASILAYDKQKRCQIKLKGEIEIHYDDAVAKEHWDLVQGGKESYNTKLQPGQKVSSLEDSHEMKSEYDAEFFAVMVLKVSEAEILQLNSDGHIRALFDSEKDTSSYLVP